MATIDNENHNIFQKHMSNFIGETITIYTLSGGNSGNGFTGVLLEVNDYFIRILCNTPLSSQNPFTENIPPQTEHINKLTKRNRRHSQRNPSKEASLSPYIYSTNVIADIPINRIASFIHNTF